MKSSNETPPVPTAEPDAEDWGSYASKRARKLVAGADATPEQRLMWLEEALRLALRSGALERRRSGRR
jgi:hypothetical protein